MEHYRERIPARGTSDCPFSQYHLHLSHPGSVFAHTHWHPEAEILYMKTGLVEVRCDKLVFSLSPGQIAFISPGTLHAIYALEADSSYDAFVFSFDLLSLPPTHFFQKELVTPLRSGTHKLPCILQQEDLPYASVRDALEHICQCPPSSPQRKRIVFTSMVQVFTAMMDMLQVCSVTSYHKSNVVLKQCLQFMQAHYSERITLQQIADHVHLHPNYLCSMFKDYTGQTVFQQLILIRIEKAAALLQQKCSVAEAASACGFDNTGYFAKKFKAVMGCGPKEYSLRR